MLSRLPVLQPLGTDSLQRTTVAEEVEKHLNKRRAAAATASNETSLYRKARSACRPARSSQHILTDISCTADRDDPRRIKSGEVEVEVELWMRNECRLLCEYWGRVARRAPKKFAYDGFSEDAVKKKLMALRKILPDELYNMPLHVLPEELEDTWTRWRTISS